MRSLPLVSIALAVILAVLVATVADLRPRIDDRFFFAADSPAYKEAQEIRKKFTSQELLVVTAHTRDLDSPQYLQRVASLTERLDALKRVHSATSLSQGPKGLKDVRESPLWRRLLLLPDAQASNIVLTVDDSDGGALIDSVMSVLHSAEAPDFRLTLAGVPYVVDDIGKNLQGDFSRFSAAAIVVFALLTTLLFRSWAVLLGSLTACTVAALSTLLVQQALGQRIGMLTANLVTIAFVLTQSHLVFMTNNWRHSGDVREAVMKTLQASAWCMVAALLGFASLWTVEAQPLRELGHGGVLATVCAILAAYCVYPPFLLWAKPRAHDKKTPEPAPRLLQVPPRWLAVAAVAACMLGWIGVPFINSDPSLLEYFDRDSEVHRSLAEVDPHGGTNPLSLTVRRFDHARLDTDEAYRRLWKLQNALQDDPAVGTVVSLPVLMAEADRSPIATVLPWNWLIDILEKPRYDRVARGFLTADRTQTQFLMRMYESDRHERRTEVIARLKVLAEKQGWETVAVGGTYALQGRLADLVYDSLYEGLEGLLCAIALIGFIVTRSLTGALAMLACTATVPAITLGSFGLFGIPLDIIATPGVNVAIGVAVDSMIHLGAAWRRTGDLRMAQQRQSGGILAFSLVVLCGFAIFTASSFPPTRRFGLAVMIGAAVAGVMALWVFPGLLSFADGGKRRRRSLGEAGPGEPRGRDWRARSEP